ncbi:MAG TPA: hypothetical protein VHD63_24685, partial [Ktedonobacteraceae bacterium]|nr:hypothetical protein [Ktedonobacteraceae bacterium]
NRETPSHPRSISMASPLSPEIKPAEHAQPPQHVYDTPEAEVPRIDMPQSSPHTSQREVAAEHAKESSPHTAQREVAAARAKHGPDLTSVRPAHAAFAQQTSSRQAGLEGSQPEAEPKASDANLPEGRGLPGIVAPLPSRPASLPALKAQIQIPYAGTRTVSAGLSATEVASAERPASTAPFVQPARPEAEEDRTRQAVSPFHAEEQRHRLEKALPGTQRLAGEPVPEIQIHIGRIEVRATPAAARSVAKQAAPARPALSLSAYLERRRGNEQ